MMQSLRKFFNQLTNPISSEQANHLLHQGNALLGMRKTSQAIAKYEKARDIYAQLQDVFGEASTLGQLSIAYAGNGEQEKAKELLEETLNKGKQLNNNQIICSALGNLGLLEYQRVKLDSALSYFMEALEYSRSLEDTSVYRFTLNHITNTLIEQGLYDKAIHYCEQFMQANKSTDNRRDDAVCLCKMAHIYALLCNRERGIPLVKQAIEILEKSNNPEAGNDLLRARALLAQITNNNL